MATLHTLPQSATLVRAMPHEHAWCTESQHATSLGRVLYVRCPGCGKRRVDLQPRFDLPPAALSRTLGGEA